MAARLKDQRGQGLVLVALAVVMLFGFAAIGIDQSLAMSDRRELQAAADTAAIAGTRQYSLGLGADTAHFVAMQYLVAALGFTMPATCPTALACGGFGGSHTFTSGSWTVVMVDGTGATLDVFVSHARPTELARTIGITTQVVARAARARYTGNVASGYAVMSLAGNFAVDGGGTSAPTGDVSGAVYANGSAGANNGPHAIEVPTLTTDYTGASCSPPVTNHIDTTGPNSGSFTWAQTAGGPLLGQSNVIAPLADPFEGVPPPVPSPNPTYNSSGQALVGSTWQPGTYAGFFPQATGAHGSALSMAPGVYVIQNMTGTMTVGGNKVLGSPQHGGVDTTGAVSIVLDSTDSGSLDLSQANLNGLDDNGATPRDPLGTHNMAVYGRTYTGATSFGSGNSGPAYITGIVELPLSGVTATGTPTFHFYGETVAASMDLKGGGGGRQTFFGMCGLKAVTGSVQGVGLVR